MEHFPLNVIHDISNIIYPKLCAACHETLNKHEKVICLKCQLGLPKTDHVLYDDNPVAKKFWGKVPIERALAMYHFHKTSRLQEVMHALKYKGRQDVGIRLGNLMGYHLQQYQLFADVDYLTAVPQKCADCDFRRYILSENLQRHQDLQFKSFRLWHTWLRFCSIAFFMLNERESCVNNRCVTVLDSAIASMATVLCQTVVRRVVGAAFTVVVLVSVRVSYRK